MIKFIKKTVDIIYEKEKNNLSNTIIIMPNERSCFYFHTYFKEKLQSEKVNSCFFPKIIPFKQFLIHLSGFNKESDLNLIFKMHKILNKFYNTHNKQGNLSITNTYDLCKILINDFSLFDNFLQTEEKLDYLSNLKEISERFSEKSYNFLQQVLEKSIIYKHLKEIYSEFTKDNYSSYEANILRKLYNNIETILSKLALHNLYFIGLFFLTKLEEEILKKFSEHTNCFFIIENSTFLNKIINIQEKFDNLKKLFKNKVLTIDNTNEVKVDTINVKYCANNTSQVALIIDTLTSLINSGVDQNEIAIILTDEHLLPLLIKQLPENITFNITMSYKIRFTYVFKTLFLLFNIYENTVNNFTTLDQLKLLEYNKLLNIKLPEFLSNCKYNLTCNIEILKENLPAEVYEFISNKDKQNPFDVVFNLLYLIEKNVLSQNIETSELKLEYEAIMLIKKVVKEIEKFSDEIKNTDEIIYILKQILKEEKIILEGKPLNGVQILGKFESRLLDFKYVIIPSFTDKYWPYKYLDTNTFLFKDIIDVRIKLKDVYYTLDAYLFYRLINNAEQTILIVPSYINNQPVFESPLLTQLSTIINNDNKTHLPNTKIVIPFTIEDFALYSKRKINIAICKKYNEFYNNISLSRYAIENFIKCPLKFYYSNILKLKKSTLLPVDMPQSLIGNIVHELIEKWLSKEKKFAFKGIKKFSENNIVSYILKALFDKITYNNEININDVKEINQIKMIVTSIINNFEENFEKDDNTIKTLNGYTVYEIEKEFCIQKQILNKNITLKGIIDCIGKGYNNEFIIIDFKNSKSNYSMFVKDVVKSHFVTSNKFKSYNFQLQFYTFLLKHNINVKEVRSGIMFLKDNSKIFKENYIKDFEFENFLCNSVLSTLIETNVFEQTEYKNEICRDYYNFTKCDFIHYCNL
ncbi:MAG: PD-(D/E)XK nuclease family protein [Bacteroidales bacterium]|nr:PD-(D/E)XK nuclease family protein [Bacteroidales bacterium]